MLPNIDMACDDEAPICQDTGMPTFVIHTPVGREPDRDHARRSARRSPRPRGAASCGPTRSIRSPARTAATTWATETPVIHFEQWEEDEIEVKLILKGGGCENKNIQYSLPCDLDHLGRADRNLEGVRKCILHAVWQAQGQGCAPGALGVCIGSDRAHGYDLAKQQLFRTLDDVNPEPGAGRSWKREIMERGQQARRRRHGLRRQGVADRLQDHRGQPAAGELLRFGGLRLLGFPAPGRAAGRGDRRDHRAGSIAIRSARGADGARRGLPADRPRDRADAAAHRRGRCAR